jgi:hypothetical protein
MFQNYDIDLAEQRVNAQRTLRRLSSTSGFFATERHGGLTRNHPRR